MNKVSLTVEQFVTLWQEAQTTKELIRKTGMNYNYALNKANKLRRDGHFLKHFSRLTKEGEVQGSGLMTWLKQNHLQVYTEWKEEENARRIHSKNI